jgi:hypothetical protein
MLISLQDLYDMPPLNVLLFLLLLKEADNLCYVPLEDNVLNLLPTLESI